MSEMWKIQGDISPRNIVFILYESKNNLLVLFSALRLSLKNIMGGGGQSHLKRKFSKSVTKQDFRCDSVLEIDF